MIICSWHRQQRIEQARLLQVIGIVDLGALAAAALEYGKMLARLRNLPAAERLEPRTHALGSREFLRGRGNRIDALGQAVRRIAFAEARILIASLYRNLRCCRPLCDTLRRESSCWC
jgi:hypothetical protein